MISILVPSRGRPDQLVKLWWSALNQAEGEIELVVRLDDDDPSNYDRLDRASNWGAGVEWVVGRRTVLSKCWNEAYDRAHGEIVMHAGDDIRFRTAGWDRLVEEAFETVDDRILFVHGRDGYQDEKLGTHGFLHRRWVETVGYFVPPYFSSDYNDLWLHEIAETIGRRRYLPDLLTEHMHFAAGKGVIDQTHRERLDRHRADDVDGLYRRLAPERAADAEKLRAATT